MRKTLLALLLGFAAAACGDDTSESGIDNNTPGDGDSSNDTGTDTAVPAALTLSLSSSSLTIEPGSSASVTATLARTGLDGVLVTLSIAGLNDELSMTTGAPTVADTIEFTLSAIEAAAFADHQLTVTATAGTVAASALLDVDVALTVADRVGYILSGGYGRAGLPLEIWGDGAATPVEVTTDADGQFSAPDIQAPYAIVSTTVFERPWVVLDVTGTNHTFSEPPLLPIYVGQTVTVNITQSTAATRYCTVATEHGTWSYGSGSTSVVVQTAVPLQRTLDAKVTCVSLTTTLGAGITAYYGSAETDITLSGTHTDVALTLGDAAVATSEIPVSITNVPENLVPRIYVALGPQLIGIPYTTTPTMVRIPNTPGLDLNVRASAIPAPGGSIQVFTGVYAGASVSPSTETLALTLPALPTTVSPAAGATNVARDAVVTFSDTPDVVHFAYLPQALLVMTKKSSIELASLAALVGPLPTAMSLQVGELPSSVGYDFAQGVGGSVGSAPIGVGYSRSFTLVAP